MTREDIELRGYQQAAVDRLRSRRGGWGVFLGMGAGKTRIALAALSEEHLPVLVVAPKLVALTSWTKELEELRPDLTYSLVSGTPTARAGAWEAKADVYVSTLQNFAEVLDSDIQPKTVIWDELSAFKNHSSKRTKAARKVASQATYRWGLTGTPMPNSVGEIFSQMLVIDLGEALGRSVTRFRLEYQIPARPLPNGIVPRWEDQPDARERVTELLRDRTFSMQDATKDIVSTDIHYITEQVEPTEEQKRLLKEAAKESLIQLGDMSPGEVLPLTHASALTQKSHQICAGGLYGEEDEVYTVPSRKIEALKDIAALEGNTLIFYWFKFEHDQLKEQLDGAVDVTEPGAVERWNAGDIKYLLAHPQSAGHGLNLQYGGSTIIWTTPTWSTELWQQGNKRLHRPGQTRPVTVYTLSTRGSVEELIASRVHQKGVSMRALLDALDVS